MRFLVPLFVFLAVAGFHSVLSASLESAEKEEKVAKYDELAELKKIDQMEFEAAQKNQAAEMNVTEDRSEDTHYLEAVQDGSEAEHVESGKVRTERGGSSESKSSDGQDSCDEESAERRKKREQHEEVSESVSSSEEVTPESPKEQDVTE